MELERNRFLQPPQAPAPRRKRWGGCWGGLSFFNKQKGGKRIVPASRVPEANVLSNQPNGPRIGGLPNQSAGIALSIFAPPSSPASFSNSAIPSTVQSPSCFPSASSPGGPSSTMFVTGPYAHETQLVSPPVFSTFTTEPSTAPLTPPPELAHLTTPSSPDVPYARFLSSSTKIKGTDKSGYNSGNDYPATYSPYPESPASTLRSPVSRTPGNGLSYGEREFPSQWDISQNSGYIKSNSGRFLGVQTDGAPKSRQDSNFFCPETFAQFYDLSSFSNSGGRLSISKDSDAYSNGGNAYQIKQNKNCKPDAEELDAYRASFGFSADELITTNYVEISDVVDDSFSMELLNSLNPAEPELSSTSKSPTVKERRHDLFDSQLVEARLNHAIASEGNGAEKHGARIAHGNHTLSDNEDIFSRMQASRSSRRYPFGSSNSDAEIEYRRARSLRERLNES